MIKFNCDNQICTEMKGKHVDKAHYARNPRAFNVNHTRKKMQLQRQTKIRTSNLSGQPSESVISHQDRERAGPSRRPGRALRHSTPGSSQSPGSRQPRRLTRGSPAECGPHTAHTCWAAGRAPQPEPELAAAAGRRQREEVSAPGGQGLVTPPPELARRRAAAAAGCRRASRGTGAAAA